MKFFKYIYSLIFIIIGLLELASGQITIKGVLIDSKILIYSTGVFFIFLGIYIAYLAYNDKEIEI